MLSKRKLALLATTSVALLALPVVAGHNIQNLRGTFPVANNASPQPYISSNQMACAGCAPGMPVYQTQAYQMPQPQIQYAAAPTYVATGTNHFGLRGLSTPGGVYYSQSAANSFYRDRARQFDIGGVTVRTNVAHTDRMLDWQENTTGKTLTLLTNRAYGVLQPDSLYLGAGFKGGFMWQQTDQPGQFPLLSRFPFFSNGTDQEAGVFAINNAALAVTSTFGDWTTVYLQPEYSETEYAPDQSEFQLRKAFVVFGNLERSPFYAAFGRKTIDFGNFDSYNAFTHNEAAHYFHAVSDQPVLELGYYKNGLKLTGSAFSGGRQLRVAYAQENNNIANYAFNAEQEFRFGYNGEQSFTVGGGYLHDTIYRNNFTAHTFQGIANGTPPANFIEYRNSVVSGFAEYNSPLFDAMVEYATTLEPWAAAIPQDANGVPDAAYLIDPLGSTTDLSNINFDQNLEVLVAQLRFKPMVNGRRMSIAASGSWGNIGDDFVGVGVGGRPTTWEKNQQHAVSVEYPISPYLEVGAEYVYNKGFIPFVAPQLVSNDETNAHAVNVGFKARF